MTRNDIDFLEQQLLAAGRAIAFPPTPDVSAGFWRRLGTSPARRPRLGPLGRAGLAFAAAALVVAVAVVAVSPARDAAAGLAKRINIFETDRSTEGLPTEITGRETTLERAETALGAHILQPSDASLKLERVLLQEYGGTEVAVLFYRGGGVDFALFASNAHVAKGIPLGADVDVEPVSGLGDEAYWLAGRRIVQSLTPGGDVATGSERVTDVNALIWDQDGYVYRIEGDMDKDRAIAIAESVR